MLTQGVLFMEAKEILKSIIDKYTVEICNDKRRLESLLKDYLVNDKKAVNLLMLVCESGVCIKLLKDQTSNTVDEILFNRLSYNIVDNYGMDINNVHWAIDAWIYALGKRCNYQKKENSVININGPKENYDTKIKANIKIAYIRS